MAKPVGWRNESRRHALASRGIKTAVKGKPTVILKDNPRIWVVTYTYRGKEERTVPLNEKEAKERVERFESQGRKNVKIVKDVRLGEVKEVVSPSENPVNKENLVDNIMEYEGGNMTIERYLYFFGYLIKTGQAWSLQGSYGRMAHTLIDEGLIDKNGNVVWKEVDAKGIDRKSMLYNE